MVGIYFSGTGNTKYCVERFVKEYDPSINALSMEAPEAVEMIRRHEKIIFGYPVQFSNIPKIVRDFICQNPQIWHGKKIFVIATMGLFGGDAAGILARLLKKYGAVIVGGLHLNMPDSVCDKKALKRPMEQNRKLVANAVPKIQHAVNHLKNGVPPQDGLSVWKHLTGLFGQRLYFYNKTKHYSDQLNVHQETCIGCGQCVSACPMKNLVLREHKAVPADRCTMCYRCVSLCPAQAITLLGKQVYEQCRMEKYG